MKALVEYYSWDQCPVLLFKKCEALTGNCGVYFILTAFSIFIEYAVAFCQCLFIYPSDFMPEEKYEGGVAFSETESSPIPASLSLARGSCEKIAPTTRIQILLAAVRQVTDQFNRTFFLVDSSAFDNQVSFLSTKEHSAAIQTTFWKICYTFNLYVCVHQTWSNISYYCGDGNRSVIYNHIVYVGVYQRLYRAVRPQSKGLP